MLGDRQKNGNPINCRRNIGDNLILIQYYSKILGLGSTAEAECYTINHK
jgi:hypothetical protein